MQIYSVFLLAFKYFKMCRAKSNQIIAWKCNGLSEENIKAPTRSNNSIAPGMTFFNGAKVEIKFDGGYVKQEKIIFHHGNVIHVLIVYEINL